MIPEGRLLIGLLLNRASGRLGSERLGIDLFSRSYDLLWRSHRGRGEQRTPQPRGAPEEETTENRKTAAGLTRRDLDQRLSLNR